jgi:surface polysaccharide O-acyltransferase-like enzyme
VQTLQPAVSVLLTEKSRNYAVDVFRLLGAFCVVALHSPLGTLPNSAALAIRLGSRWAVPFFFLVSGYFVAQSWRDKQPLNCSKSLNNLLAIFLVVNSIYGLFYLLDANPATTIQLTFSGLLIGQSGHLWYIGATIFGLLLLQYLASRYSDSVLLGVALGTLGLILVGYDYASFSGLHMQQEVARYLTAIPFIFGGFLVARHPNLLRHLPEAIALYKLTGASPHNQELLLGTALLAFGLFCLSLTFRMPTPNAFAAAGKTYSLLIYLYHPLVIAVVYSLLHLGNYHAYYFWFSPLLVFALTLLSVKLVHRFSPPAFRLLSGGY